MDQILSYIEPHPLRDSFTSHNLPYNYIKNIVQKINSNYSDKFEAKIFTNHVYANLLFQENYDLWPMTLVPTPAMATKIETLAKMWIPHGMRDWISLMQDPNSDIANFYYQLLTDLKSRYNFNCLVSWGQNAAVEKFCSEHNIQTIYLELASMRSPFPDALLIDPLGVNGNASTTKIDLNQLLLPNPISREVIYHCLSRELQDYQQVAILEQGIFSPLSDDIASFLRTDQQIALVPLQLADDANLLLYSDVQSIYEFCEKTLGTLLDNSFKVILKTHPGAKIRGGYVNHEQDRCIKKFAEYNDVLILDRPCSVDEYSCLLNSVNLVVTNNSSVGFESLIMGTPCCVQGQACYKFKNSIPNLESYSSGKKLNQEQSNRLLSYTIGTTFCLSKYLVPGILDRITSWKETSKSDLSKPEWLLSNYQNLAWKNWNTESLLKSY